MSETVLSMKSSYCLIEQFAVSNTRTFLNIDLQYIYIYIYGMKVTNWWLIFTIVTCKEFWKGKELFWCLLHRIIHYLFPLLNSSYLVQNIPSLLDCLALWEGFFGLWIDDWGFGFSYVCSYSLYELMKKKILFLTLCK